MSRSALVVGAGISGMTTAIALRSAGWRVDLEDQGTRLDDRGAALGIWPHAWRGLTMLGVTDKIRDAFDYTSATIRSRQGNVMGHLPLASIERSQGAPVRLVLRPMLMQALLETLERDSGPEITFGSRFDPQRDTSTYDLVVGADGINSRVRGVVVPGAAGPRRLGATAWRGACEGHLGGWGEIWGRGMFAGVTPAGHHRTNWYVAVADSLAVDSVDDLLRLLTGWPEEIREAVENTPTGSVLRHELLDLPPLGTFVRGRHVLVGDAAHAMAPSLGQGACQAIVDALELGRACDTHEDIGAALASYNMTQRRAGNRLVRRSRQLLRVQLSPRLAPMRNTVLQLARPLAPR